jgi:hypothetical protein
MFGFDIKVDASIVVRGNINAWNIKAWNIDAWNIDAGNINAWDINARNIKAWDIDAGNILYYAVAFAYTSFKCRSIKGVRDNAKHFCLDSAVIVNGKKEESNGLPYPFRLARQLV